MSDYPQTTETAVDRREETVVTQQPGYTATAQVVRDVAAERRMQNFQVARIVYTLLGILEILLGLRFVLKLIGADAQTGFAAFIFGITSIFMAPFTGLVATWTSGAMSLEMSALIAMAVYALLAWVLLRVFAILMDRPSARSVTRSTHEQTPGAAVQVAPVQVAPVQMAAAPVAAVQVAPAQVTTVPGAVVQVAPAPVVPVTDVTTHTTTTSSH